MCVWRRARMLFAAVVCNRLGRGLPSLVVASRAHHLRRRSESPLECIVATALLLYILSFALQDPSAKSALSPRWR